METLRLALVCLKVGTFVFGGGMSMIPLMEQDVVNRYHWLTHDQFMDAVALGQMTPGPLLVSATFIGYKIGGPFPATVATLCIFLPSCLMTILVTHQLVRLKNNPYVQGFLRGVTPAVVGLLLSAGVHFGQSALWPQQRFDARAAVLTALALGVLVGPKILGQASRLPAYLRPLQKVDAVHVILAAGLMGWWVCR